MGSAIRPVLGVFLAGLAIADQTTDRVSPDWYLVNVGSGVTPFFAFDRDGGVHLVRMFDDSKQEEGPAIYSYAPGFGGPWRETVLGAGSYAGAGDIVVAKDGFVHLTFHDHIGAALHFVVARDGTVTQHFVPPAGPHDGWDGSLAFDSAGRLHLSSVAPVTDGAASSLEYGWFDGSAWTFSLVPGTDPFAYGLGTTMGVDSADRVHIAFCTADERDKPGDLVHATRDPSGWTFETVAEGGLSGRFPSLAVGGTDRLHLAWWDLDQDDPRRATVVYALNEGSGWKQEVVGRLEDVRLGYMDCRRPLTLALDSTGAPRLAFSDARRVVYAARANGGWDLSTVLEAGEDRFRATAVMRLDSQDQPAIVIWHDLPADTRGAVRFLVRRQHPAPLFHRGDPDSSGELDLSDAIRIFGFLFLGLPDPTCIESADTDNSGAVDLSDGVFILMSLFLNPMRAPSPGFASEPCGADPDLPGGNGDLGCLEYAPCR